VVPELSHFDLRKLPFRSLPAKRGLKVKAPISIRAGQAELEKKKILSLSANQSHLTRFLVAVIELYILFSSHILFNAKIIKVSIDINCSVI